VGTRARDRHTVAQIVEDGAVVVDGVGEGDRGLAGFRTVERHRQPDRPEARTYVGIDAKKPDQIDIAVGGDRVSVMTINTVDLRVSSWRSVTA
jgi:hypothetical protein